MREFLIHPHSVKEYLAAIKLRKGIFGSEKTLLIFLHLDWYRKSDSVFWRVNMWSCSLRPGMSKGSCFVWPSTISSTTKVGEWSTLENIITLLLVN